jgi:putative spermidine/putrescine transport system substrate-binding protein
MDRRSFLLGTSGIIASQMLVGCGEKNQIQFKVNLLKSSIPAQVVDKFQKSLGAKANLKFVPIEQIDTLFKQLQTWQKPGDNHQEGWQRFIPFRQNQKASQSDLVTLGDYWLKAAIEQKLIQPLAVQQMPQWSAINLKWQELVTRDEQGNLDVNGQVWAAPYRWGSTVLVYNREKLQKFDWQPRDWSDLWSSYVRSRVSLLNHPREVIGLVLKKLGKSYNTENLLEIRDLEKELQTLAEQVKFYDSTTYLEPLIIGDTWLAVGWSNDVIPILNRYPKLGVVIPESGTAIWSDLWVKPAGVETKELQSQWIDFCWQPNIANQITRFTKTNSPIFTKNVASELPPLLQNLLLTNQNLFDKSEFLLPLSAETNKQYEYLFKKMKTLDTSNQRELEQILNQGGKT